MSKLKSFRGFESLFQCSHENSWLIVGIPTRKKLMEKNQDITLKTPSHISPQQTREKERDDNERENGAGDKTFS
jgi:hypothetical protein